MKSQPCCWPSTATVFLILFALGCQVNAVDRAVNQDHQPDNLSEDDADSDGGADELGSVGDALGPSPLLTPDEDGSQPSADAAVTQVVRRQPSQQSERPPELLTPDEDGSEPPGTAAPPQAARLPAAQDALAGGAPDGGPHVQTAPEETAGLAAFERIQDDVRNVIPTGAAIGAAEAIAQPAAALAAADALAQQLPAQPAIGAVPALPALPVDLAMPAQPVVPDALGSTITLPMKGLATSSLRGAATTPLNENARITSAEGATKGASTSSRSDIDVDEQADDALVLLHKRLAEGKQEDNRLRKRLAGTIRWGLKLKRALLDEQRAEDKEKRRTKALINKQEHQTSVALDKARKREMVLTVNLQNATRTAGSRATTLRRLQAKLANLQRDRNGLHQQLAVAANNTLALRSHISQELAMEADLRQKVAKSNAELSRHLRIEKQGRQAEAADRQKIASEAAALQKVRAELVKARSGQEHQDAALNTTRRELKASWALLKQNKEIQHDQDLRIRELLGKEKTAEERAKLLSQELEVQKKQVLSSREHEQQMGQLVNALRDNVRREVSNLTWRLGIAEANQKDLKDENERLKQLLRGNTTRISHLQTEVGLLKKRVDDGDAARQRAEKAASKAEEERAAAEAVSKQLSGTVPKLLEQAQMAHEARDTEKAMRAQAQEAQQAARSEIVNLESQYTNEVEEKLDQLNQVLPKLSAVPQAASNPPKAAVSTAGASAEDLSLADLENEAPIPAAPVTEDLADAVGRAATATSDMDRPVAGAGQQKASAHRPVRSAQAPPDLAKDSQGLGMLLSQDGDDEGPMAPVDATTMVGDASDES